MQVYKAGIDIGSTTVKLVVLDGEDRPFGAGKSDTKEFVEYGYVPHAEEGSGPQEAFMFSASHTLEYAYQAYAVAQLAKKLGKELGLPVYDREILRMASDQSGINEEMFGEVDEHVRKIFLSAKAHYKGLPLSPEYAAFTSDDNLFELQADVIKRIANTQSCIIVGRCADYILKDRAYVLSLFFYAFTYYIRY